MKRRQFVLGLVGTAAALAGCETMHSLTGSSSGLTHSVASGVGVSEAQANAGVGTVLSYAKEQLSTADFNTIAKSIPGADSYMKAATDKLGMSKIGSSAGLNSSLTKLGFSQDQINKFVPMVTDYVGKQGGEYAKNLLLGALR